MLRRGVVGVCALIAACDDRPTPFLDAATPHDAVADTPDAPPQLVPIASRTPGADACAVAAREALSAGCEYWATQTPHTVLGRLAEGARRDDHPFAVVLSNPWATPVAATLSGGTLAAPTRVVVPPQDSRAVDIPWDAALVDAGDHTRRRSVLRRAGAVHIVAEAPLEALQISPRRVVLDPSACEGRGPDTCYAYSADASRLWPAHALGREHTVVTLPTQRVLAAGATRWSAAPGFVAVVATEDRTELTLTTRGTTVAGEGLDALAAGATGRVVLNAGDVALWVGPSDEDCTDDVFEPLSRSRFCRAGPGDDLTGSALRASAPVAVFVGHDCAMVPFDRFACDHLEEQLPPHTALGTRYHVARVVPVLPRLAGDPPEGEPAVLRIVATRDDTTLRVTPTPPEALGTLRAGQAITLTTRDDLLVEATAAVVVATLRAGSEWWPATVPITRAALGDPAMAIEAPTAQRSAEHTVWVPDGYDRAWAVATLPAGARVRVDGALATETPREGNGQRVQAVALRPGWHRLSAEPAAARFGVRVEAVAPFAAMAYGAGGSLRAVEPPQ